MHSKTFIHQLHALLEEPQLQPWITWSPDDESVFIVRPYDRQFSSLVLKRYFKHGNISSFVRQLHMYGFHKLSKVPDSSSGSSGSSGKSDDSGNSGSPGSSSGKKSNTPKDQSSTKWYFTHPLGFFKKSADAATLKRIQRKSAGVGKDGKRKNVLSTVCVNYIEPTSVDNNNTSERSTGEQDLTRLRQQQLSPLTQSTTAQRSHQQQSLLQPQPLVNNQIRPLVKNQMHPHSLIQPNIPLPMQPQRQLHLQPQLKPHLQGAPDLQEFNAGLSPLNDRKHYGSLPQLPVVGSSYGRVRQHEHGSHQSLLPYIHRKDHLFEKPRTISSPEILQRSALQKNLAALPAATKSSVSMAMAPRTSTPTQTLNPQLHPLGYYFPNSQYSVNRGQFPAHFSTPSSVVSSTGTIAYLPYFDQRLESGIRTLQNSVLTLADMLPSMCKDITKQTEPDNQPNFEYYMKTIQSLKDDILAENACTTDSRYSQSSFGGTTASSSISHPTAATVGLNIDESTAASINHISMRPQQKSGSSPTGISEIDKSKPDTATSRSYTNSFSPSSNSKT
ncbi:hypothetical protein HG535_0E00960 [Zygotorulaspora mrakii]|uniref:HSF-type DNA-binding domain-containing protein n=1 Tax=Zygotorulaspora mrakii TaxID=42260 RepID=A0A7H9B5G4_ZYGMR|nr:uncharacterized protein HG535_0E00960 [Zygotorulaspora mrakii]QLG73012.1 hypothetical protein HG535_0E00960 [Zygotorulaspora mrakii]